MNQAQEFPLESEIGDFAEILRHEDANELPVVVGGHTAGLWSRYFLSRGVTKLAEFLPFRSKDLDLVGTVGLLDELHRRFKGRLLRNPPPDCNGTLATTPAIIFGELPASREVRATSPVSATR